MDSSLATGLALILLSLLAVGAYQLALPQPIPSVPYDASEARNILGSIPALLGHLRRHGVVIPWMTGLNARHGGAPLVQFFGLPFSTPTLVLSDFREAQDVLIRRTREFDRAQRTLDGFVGTIPHHHISMRTQDPRFRGNKELVRDLMSPAFLNQVSGVQIYAKSLALVSLWSAKADIAKGRPFAARQDVFNAAMDMVNAAAFAFGDELSITKQTLAHITAGGPPRDGGPDDPVEFSRPARTPEIVALQDSADFLGSQVVSPMPRLTTRYKLLTDWKLRRQLAAKDEVIKAQLRKSLERLEAGDQTQFSATDYLIQREYSVARKEKRAPDFFSRRTIDELFGYVVGGHETTATALCWMLKLISDHQHVQQKLRHAMKTALAAAAAESRLPTAEEITKTSIPYLDASIEESLRLGTPTPLVAREAMEDTVLLGHRVPKGTALLISSVGPSFRSAPADVDDAARSETSRTKHWGGAWDPEDMEVFRPERWLREAGDGDGDGDGRVTFDPQAGPFLTFSLGPRGCFGRKLAYLEMRLMLTLLLWKFQFRKLGGELASYKTDEAVTVMPANCFVGIDLVE